MRKGASTMHRSCVPWLVLLVGLITCARAPRADASPSAHEEVPPDDERPTEASPCGPGETAMVVDTRAHRLTLCEAGRARESFPVALGSGGVDKRRVGDNKTPLGAYGLGAPRASQDFHLFVPVAYPTAAQARLGFTGSAIGIHGPPRGFAGALARIPVPLPDWTAGCIAVRTDAEIDRIAAWLRARTAPRIRLEPGSRLGSP